MSAVDEIEIPDSWRGYEDLYRYLVPKYGKRFELTEALKQEGYGPRWLLSDAVKDLNKRVKKGLR